MNKAWDLSTLGAYKRYAALKLLQPARLGLPESKRLVYHGSPAWANSPGRLHGHTFEPRSTELFNPGEGLLKIDTDALTSNHWPDEAWEGDLPRPRSPDENWGWARKGKDS